MVAGLACSKVFHSVALMAFVTVVSTVIAKADSLGEKLAVQLDGTTAAKSESKSADLLVSGLVELLADVMDATSAEQ